MAIIRPFLYSYFWSRDSRSRAKKSSTENQSSLCATIFILSFYLQQLFYSFDIRCQLLNSVMVLTVYPRDCCMYILKFNYGYNSPFWSLASLPSHTQSHEHAFFLTCRQHSNLKKCPIFCTSICTDISLLFCYTQDRRPLCRL